MSYVYQMSQVDLSRDCNIAKEEVVRALGREGYLTEEQVQEINEKYSMIVAEKGWLGRMVDRILFKDIEKGALVFTLVKQV